MKTTVLTATLLTALLTSAISATAAPTEVRLSIESQPVDAALLEFSRQTGVQVVLDSQVGKALVAPEVSGNFTPEGALQALLQGSGLKYEFLNIRTVAIREKIAGQTTGLQLSSPINLSQAETSSSASPPAQSASGGNPEGVAHPNSGIEEVIVTAQKRSERVLDIPASVSAITGRKLENLNVKGLMDYASYIPGFNIQSIGTPGRTVITLRGIANVGPGATVGTYIDDVPVGSSSGKTSAPVLMLDLMPYDLDRLEVLRGPQGTLYGASAMGGIVKYALVAPALNAFSVKLGASSSTIDGADDLGWGLRGAANIPLVADKLALRASVYDEQTPGYVNNLGTRVNGANDVSQMGGRVSVLWKAAEAVSVTLGGMWQRLDADDLAKVTLNNLTSVTAASGARFFSGSPTLGELSLDEYAAAPFKKDIDLYTMTINADLGFANLVSASSYSRLWTELTIDNTLAFGSLFPALSGGAVPAGIAVLTNTYDFKKYTQEFRLSSHSGRRIEWLAGAFYTLEDGGYDTRIAATTFTLSPIPFFGAGLANLDIPSRYEEAAAFGDLTVHLTERLDIMGGARYAKSNQDWTQVASGPLVGNATTSNTFSESVFTWMFSPRYHITPEAMVYARVATGFRPGGPNATIPNVPVASAYQADKLTNYEVGFKADFYNNRATINLSAFYIEWTDIQLTLTDPRTPLGYLGNAGLAISKGLEFEASLIPLTGLRLGLNAAYTDAYIDELGSNVAAVNRFAIGEQLRGVPKWSGALTADYTFPLNLGWQGNIGGGLRYVGKKNSLVVISGGNNVELDSYRVLDLSAGISRDEWSVQLFARNVTNTRAFTDAELLSAAGVPRQIDASLLQPRTVGLSFDRSF